jgi:hypothetical protein
MLKSVGHWCIWGRLAGYWPEVAKFVQYKGSDLTTR